MDEIHRFNKAQQDAFLAHVERGDIVFIGATTENPSFEVNSALLSRARVLVLQASCRRPTCASLLERALTDPSAGSPGASRPSAEALDLLAAAADGDARRALTTLEIAAANAEASGRGIVVDDVREALARKHLRYDKAGEEHYNLISALHKSLRDSDVGRRALLVRAHARRGRGSALPRATAGALRERGRRRGRSRSRCSLAIAAFQAYHQLGSPEGELAIAQAVVHLALAPKSNAIYKALRRGDGRGRGERLAAAAARHPQRADRADEGAGLRRRATCTRTTIPGRAADQQHLPDELVGKRWYPKEG